MKRRALMTALALLSLLVAVVALWRSPAGQAPTVVADPVKQQLTYVVAPHPDDEWQAWSLIANRPDVYHVFVLLTRGEATSHCAGRGLQEQHGERHPLPRAETPTGFGAVGSDICKAQRLDSWHTWLDAQGDLDPGFGTGAQMRRFQIAHPERGSPDDAGRSDWQVGPRSARVAFDLGDGDLTEEEVIWAVQTVRRHRDRLPDLREGDVVGASYYNRLPSCYVYEHADHLQVQRALAGTDLGVPGDQWGATCRDDPRASRTEEIPEAVYEANMAPRTADPDAAPEAPRTGHFQVVYGWLGFPGDYFPSGTGNAVLFSQSQAFWRRE